MARVFLISDLHLSPTHGYFWENWRLVRDAANRDNPDLVVVCGDLCINGPDSEEEVIFLAQTIGTLQSKTLVIPGNHDVGDEPPGQDPNQIIDSRRNDRWLASFGSDRFAVDAGVWRLIGINAQLYGSGLPREQEQHDWLAGQLDAARKPVALVMHKPLFHSTPDEKGLTTDAINLEPRVRLMNLLKRADVRLVISGHLHGYRDWVHECVRYLWLPSTAFLGVGVGGSKPMVAAMSIDLSDEAARTDFLDIPLEPYSLAAIKRNGQYKFLRDTPACPPQDI